jgi:hypothetical protein
MAFKKDGFGAASRLRPGLRRTGIKGQLAAAFDVFPLGTFC